MPLLWLLRHTQSFNNILENSGPYVITMAQYSHKQKDHDKVFDLLHAAPIEKRLDIAYWISKCAPTTIPRKHRRILADTSNTQHHPSTMSGTSEKQQKANDEDVRITRSCTQDAARPGSAMSLRSGKVKSTTSEGGSPSLPRETMSAASDIISEAPSLPPPTSKASRSSAHTRSSSPKKHTITKREDLIHLTPRIDFMLIQEAKDVGVIIHESVRLLLERCEARNASTTPPISLTAANKDLIHITLTDAFEQAGQWRSTTTESHWISVVKNKASTNKNITVVNITSVEISPPSLCPYSSEPGQFNDLDKKIDYAVGLKLSRTARLTLQGAPNFIKSINQTASFVNWHPMFLNVEVKRNYVNRDPAIQLAAWIAAEFRKRKLEKWSLAMPVFAVEIQTDAWLLHLVTAEEVPENPDEFTMFFLGPLHLGNTYTMEDTKRLFHNLCDVARWGHEEYRLWVEEEIIP
ncbi:hypothetical protein GMOD_00001867 [Pyrenophora seminiperda CCB06]|uniref:PD-(D/E)XK nuclease-like domain-containing protein n=1 Tax=Pyrenophora seminiperda CCB06 TaxID=1302712 RepID=A0A3M7LWB2_9PLEO|nr:hypothetical protein GMOD_00001867 [Pyrenophora seminiperda CCB06]